MTTFFKRILSPREHRGERRNSEDLHDRSLSTSLSQGHLPTVPSPPISSASTAPGGPQRQHRRHQSNEGDSIVVDNVIYSEPTPLDRVPRAPGQGGGGNVEGQPDNPPLPPRPVSVGHPHQIADRRDEEFYVAPVDTISTRITVAPSVAASRERDRRIMRMHDLTMSQKARQGMQVHVQNVRVQQHSPSASPSVGGHRRTRSIGQVIDNSEYSTPWNVVEEQMRSAGPPRGKRVSAGRVIPSTPGDESDRIIPVSPPPILGSRERSQSSSPIPPLPSEPPPHSPGEGGGGDAEYDDPWDVRFKRINQNLHEHHSHHQERPSPPQSGGGLVRKSSPVDQRPPKPPHTKSSANTERAHRFSPPEQQLTRAHSDRPHHRGGGGGGGGGEVGDHSSDWSKGFGAPFRHRATTELHPSSGPGPVPPRTGSVSIPIQQRPLPQAPVDNRETAPPPVTREDSPPSSWFDSSLALEEQP